MLETLGNIRSIEVLLFARVEVRYWLWICVYIFVPCIVRAIYFISQNHYRARFTVLPVIGDMFFFDDTIHRMEVVASFVCLALSYLTYSTVLLSLFFIIRIVYSKALCEINFNKRIFVLFGISSLYRVFVMLSEVYEENKSKKKKSKKKNIEDISGFVGSSIK